MPTAQAAWPSQHEPRAAWDEGQLTAPDGPRCEQEEEA